MLYTHNRSNNCFQNFCSLPSKATICLRLRLSWALLPWLAVRSVQLLINHHSDGLVLVFFLRLNCVDSIFFLTRDECRQFFFKSIFFFCLKDWDYNQSIWCTYDTNNVFLKTKHFHTHDFNFLKTKIISSPFFSKKKKIKLHFFLPPLLMQHFNITTDALLLLS